ncbi:MAG: lipopolysaccharide biosynthesis protein [bacterium]
MYKKFQLSDAERVSAAVNNPLRHFILDTLRYLPAKLIPAATAFISVFIFTRMFTPEAYGIYSLVISIVVPSVIVLTEWIAQPTGRFFSEYERRGDLQTYCSTLSTFVIIIVVTGSIVGIGLAIAIGYFWGLSIGLAAGSLVLVQSLSSLLTPILPASLDPWFYRFLEVARALLRLFFSLSLILLLGIHPAFLVWGMVLGFAVLLPFLFQSVAKKVGGLKCAFHITPEIYRFARYGVPMLLWFLASQLLNVSDRYVLQVFFGSSEVGIYSANYNLITGVAGLLSAPVSLAAFPIIMYIWADGDRTSIRKTTSSMTEWYLLFGIGVLGCTLVAARDLISLVIGQAFREGYTVLVPVLAGQILWQASMLGHKGMELMENTGVMLKWVCIAAGVNLILNLLLIPRYGYLAAAYTTLFSYGLYAFLIWKSSKHYVPWDIPLRSVGLGLLIVTFEISIAYSVKIGPVLWQVALKTIIFFLIYIACIATLKRWGLCLTQNVKQRETP